MRYKHSPGHCRGSEAAETDPCTHSAAKTKNPTLNHCRTPRALKSPALIVSFDELEPVQYGVSRKYLTLIAYAGTECYPESPYSHA
jgi:hypothetical protein